MRYLIAHADERREQDVAYVDSLPSRLASGSSMWTTLGTASGLFIGYAPETPVDRDPIRLRRDRGFILGQVFETKDPDQPASPPLQGCLSGDWADEVIRSHGCALIRAFWGYYVAVIRYPRERRLVVLRAPASPMPCLASLDGSVKIFFSHMDDFRRIRRSPLSINWDSIAAQVVGGDYLAEATAYNEISELSGGEAMSCGPNGTERIAYWSPALLLTRRTLATADAARRRLRAVVDHSVASLSAGHSRILVTASGGLDSSIILASLRTAPQRPDLAAVNFHSPGAGDERRFARAVAERHRCPLHELARDASLSLARLLDCNPTARPVLNFSAPDVETRIADLARDWGATAVFNGELGDNVFGSYPNAGALIEALRQYGVGRRFASCVLDYALIHRISFWAALGATAAEYWDCLRMPDFDAMRDFRRGSGTHTRRSMLLASSAADDHFATMAARFRHPWLRGTRRLAPSAHMLLFGLITITSTPYHSPFARPGDAIQVSPLLSQPVLETAFAIPAHLHCVDGEDRAIARAAFADALPALVLDRGLGKGGPTSWAQEIVRRDARFLQEFLLDGLLVKRGLLDRPRLEAALSFARSDSSVIVGDIFAKAYIEAWLRKAIEAA